MKRMEIIVGLSGIKIIDKLLKDCNKINEICYTVHSFLCMRKIESEEEKMLKSGALYYFSPTGGTKKAGELFSQELFEKVEVRNLGKRENEEVHSDIVVVAAPVFGGRIPTFMTEQLKALKGNGKKAITLAVYGNRHYDDALLEMNDVLKEAGFQILASAALLAQHSLVPAAGAGRPDEKDAAEIRKFAAEVETKLESRNLEEPKVPGNVPYKEMKKNPATPVSGEGCIGCGACARICPVNAITVEGKTVSTDYDKCFMCMSCTSVCPMKVRALPAPVQNVMNEKLDACTKTYRANEFFI